MYHSSLAKKLKPAKRAWKSFTSNLRSKLQSLNVPKTLETITHRFINFCSLHLFIPTKKRFLSKSGLCSRGCRYNQLYQTNFAAIYIDNLYSEPYSASAHAGMSKEVAADNEKAKELSRKVKQSVYSVEDAWNAVVASSPQLRCVDERAEEFIYKFRQDMKIQRERSLLEFQEMLARGA